MEADFGRRQFLKRAATVAAAPAVLSQRNPNDKLGIAIVGVGTRGIYLHNQVQECPNTEVRVICDLYDGNIKRAQTATRYKDVLVTKDWEKAVAQKEVDAVIVATPDFWHAPMAVRAAELKKHVYVEKGLCRTLEEAKAIRKAVKDNNVTLQLGHHQNSESTFMKAREIYQSGQLGKVALARTYIDRTSPWPEWQFYTAYNIQKPPDDVGPETVDWERFQANSSVKKPFNGERFFRWRCWWEYGTGIAGDLMSHQWDGVNMIAGMGIPETCVTQAGLYFWKEDREVPDMWHVLFDYPKKELAVGFACTFHNRHHGTNTYIFGRDATIEVDSSFCRVYTGEWRKEYQDKLIQARKEARAAGKDPSEAVVPPEYSMRREQVEVTNHMRDWIDCIRSGQRPRCDIDRAWEEGVTIVMSVEAYKRRTQVRWDPVKEEIV